MSSFKKFLGNALSETKVAVSRVGQLTNEAMGLSERTELDIQFENLYNRVDRNREWVIKIISAYKALVSPFSKLTVENFFKEKIEKTETSNELNKFGTVLVQAGVDIGTTSTYGNCLNNCGGTVLEMGKYKDEMVRKAEEEFVQVLHQYLTTDLDKVKAERKKLNLLRIDLDAAKTNLKKCSPERASEALAKVRQLESDFEYQCEKTRALLEQISNEEGKQVVAFKRLFSVFLDYHQNCVNSLKSLNDSFTSSPNE